ncbi:MAG: hypothetical protein J2P17_19815, partial [Mycobacterium sp.]|nr:hypothetical protein [Mycobacterium sp.]
MGEDHYPQQRSAVRGFCLSAGAILAAAATAGLILSNDARFHKAAVIAAVWAIVLALLASGRRREEDMPSEREAELRRTFELELDREVAARREYELRLEVSMRRELENSLQQDLGEVRAQLGSLRQELAERWNGELRLERFALRAESTRLTGGDRQLLEQQAGRIGLEGSENGGRALESVNAQSQRGQVDGGTTSLPNLLGRVTESDTSTPQPAAAPGPRP